MSIMQKTKTPSAPAESAVRTQADRIIQLFGGVRALSRLTEIHGKLIPPTTISGWRIQGFVPANYHGFLLDIAWEEGLMILPTDFNPWPPAKVQRAQRQARKKKAA